MRKSIIIIVSTCIITALSFYLWIANTNKQEETILQETERNVDNYYENAEITTNIIISESNTFGYDIYVNGSLLVHQPSRPGIPGNEGFATREDAHKVADFVANKVRNNEIPPTVTNEELKTLNVL